jgi:3'(2'), 5'-bisphosphate nucleotidase
MRYRRRAMTDPRALLPELLRLAEEAGVIAARAFQSDFVVEWKGPRDPVTEIDRRVNDFLCGALARLLPEAGIVAEESDEAENAAAQAREVLVFVDPIDGTQEFVDGRPEFGVLLAVVARGEPVLGIIHEPMVHTSYYAVKGEGAFRVRSGSEPERLRVSAKADVAEAIAVVTRTHGSRRLEEAIAHLGVGKRVCGSAGLKAARIAEGSAEVWVSPGPAGMRWDVAPCEVILAEAGGRLTDGTGARFDYRAGLKNDLGILASNGLLHERAVASLAFAERAHAARVAQGEGEP